jgi:hypothetical protein
VTEAYGMFLQFLLQCVRMDAQTMLDTHHKSIRYAVVRVAYAVSNIIAATFVYFIFEHSLF